MEIIYKQLLKVNFTKGREGWKPDVIVIHIAEGTKLGKTESCDHLGTMQEFSSPLTQKSSHYLIGEEADITQLVEETDTAYANGKVVKPTAKLVLERKTSSQYVNPNLYTISIECAGYTDITSAQYDSLVWLVKDISKRWNIPIDQNHIIPHRVIRSDKRCPANISIPRLIVEATKPPMLTEQPKVNTLTPQQKQSILDVIWAFTFDNPLVERIRTLLGGSPTFGGVPRAPDWSQWRKLHIHTTCDYCGVKGTLLKPLELHHCYPYHLDPSKEKDPDNVVTLCRTCHLDHGHLRSFQSFNANIKEDIKIFRAKVDNRP